MYETAKETLMYRWGKFPERKGYLSSVLKEVTELAWCRPGAMGHPRG